MPIQTGYPNVDPFSEAAGAPPLEHKPRVEQVECLSDPLEPPIHTDGMKETAWIKTADTVPVSR